MALRTGPVTGLAASGDGSQLAFGGADGVAQLCEVATGKVVAALGEPGSPLTGVAFHPQHPQLATIDQEGTIRIWNLAERSAIARFGSVAREAPSASVQGDLQSAAAPRITRLAYSPDGLRLVSATRMRPPEIWDVATGKLALILDRAVDGADCAAFSADGRQLIAGNGADAFLEHRRADATGSPEAGCRSGARLAPTRVDQQSRRAPLVCPRVSHSSYHRGRARRRVAPGKLCHHAGLSRQVGPGNQRKCQGDRSRQQEYERLVQRSLPRPPCRESVGVPAGLLPGPRKDRPDRRSGDTQFSGLDQRRRSRFGRRSGTVYRSGGAGIEEEAGQLRVSEYLRRHALSRRPLRRSDPAASARPRRARSKAQYGR